MKIIVEDFFSVATCRENPKKLYVFGDNLDRVGKGGQAMIRDEPNTFGLATKYNVAESFSDDKLGFNVQNILDECESLARMGESYDAIVFPSRGLGTGLAALQALAPRTFLLLCSALLEKFEFNNMAYLVPLK